MSHTGQVAAIITLGVVANLAGCIGIYTYRPIDVLVLDAEYDAPIPYAQVKASYQHPKLVLNAPRSAMGLTDEDGRVTLNAAKNYSFVSWSATAPGYLADPTLGRSTPPMAIPSDWVPADDASMDKGNDAVVRLYRDPKPAITIIVPDGYRGPIGIRMDYLNAVRSNQPGRREFAFTASEVGFVEIDALRILRPENPLHEFAPRYVSGDPIPLLFDRYWEYGDDGLALRFVEDVHLGAVYALGDWDDFLAVRQIMREYSRDDPRYGRFIFDHWEALFER